MSNRIGKLISISIILFGIICLVLPANSDSQTAPSPILVSVPHPYERKADKLFVISGSLGTSWESAGTFNDKIAAAGYSRLTSANFTRGFSLDFYVGSLTCGYYNFKSLNSRKARSVDDKQLFCRSSYNIFNIGYRIYPNRKVEIAPFWGAGWSKTRYTFYYGDLLDSFNNALSNPNQEVSFVADNIVLNLGAVINFDFGKSNNGKGFIFGLKTGYIFGVEPEETIYFADYPGQGNDFYVYGGPAVKSGGPYANLQIGYRFKL
jgi:hypothetical protein